MRKVIVSLFALLFIYSCTPRAIPVIPSVTTGEVTSITTTKATFAGDVTADGGAAIMARGFCWSISQFPTISDSKISSGTGLAVFTVNITNLSPSTTYYVRAYATNSVGTTYGEQRSFTTINANIEYGSFMDTRDNNLYKTLIAGNTEWMAENLKYLPEVVGPGTTTNSYTTAYYYVAGYDSTDVFTAKSTENYKIYGVLYNWKAALIACPSGWHLPSDVEWTHLENFLADNGYNFDGTTGGGAERIAKSMATDSGWLISYIVGAVGNIDYPENRNKSGFSALPSGQRASDGGFSNVGSHSGTWWTSTEHSTYDAWNRNLFYNNRNISRSYPDKVSGFSIRCIRDN